MSRDFLIIDGKDTRDFGAWLFGKMDTTIPERDRDNVSVIGRSGDLTIDKGRYKNIQVTYDFVFPFDADRYLPAFSAFISSVAGYRRIEDSRRPEEYRMGTYKGNVTPNMSRDRENAHIRVVFNCKPQRYLKEGEKTITVTGSKTIQNPTLYTAKPLFRVYGNGTFYVGGIGVRTSAIYDYVDIDSELQDAYRGLNNFNENVELLSDVFPTFPPGNSTVTMTGITKVEIIPKWWTI